MAMNNAAVADHGANPVSEELIREHAAGWHAFTQFVKIGSTGIAVLLILMAIFLL